MQPGCNSWAPAPWCTAQESAALDTVVAFALGLKVKAATNCGSPHSELKRIISSVAKDARNAATISLDMVAAE
jgi:hypothetical protein